MGGIHGRYLGRGAIDERFEEVLHLLVSVVELEVVDDGDVVDELSI